MDIVIRKAEKKDAPELVEILKTIAELHHQGRPDFFLSGSKYKVRDIEEKIDNPDEVILVAVNEDDRVIGYTMSKIYERGGDGILAKMKTMYIDDVCVSESFRGCGTGHKLMDATVKEAENAGCHNAELNVWAFNDNAIKFYESCGMTKQRQYMEIVLDK